LLEKAEVAGPGFINFTFKRSVWQNSLLEIFASLATFGRSKGGQGKKVVIEFISANPTGPLHIGNARGGPMGDVIASLLQWTGHQVTREYYVNDVGGQIDKLGESLWCELHPEQASTEARHYSGGYVQEIAQAAQQKLGKKLSGDEAEQKRMLGRFGIDFLFEEIKKDCKDMGIHFDSYVHEKTLLISKATDEILNLLKEQGATQEKEGALWFVPDGEGKDALEDRESVLVRSNGRPTYFANDIAYHVGKYRQGYDRLINVWGSNHHGHVPRIQAAVKALGHDPARIETALYQYVRVKRGNDLVKMSKRAGNYVTAREVLDEVGCDSFRFFLLMRAAGSHLDFDIELAKTQSQEKGHRARSLRRGCRQRC
jgi:arginyl-tRNA synthetase